MMLEAVVSLIALFICATVSVALVLLFRTELKRCLCKVLCWAVFYAWGTKEVFRGLVNTKNNIQEPSAPPGGVAVITGARGMGFEVIKKLLEKNVHVIIGCRDLLTGERALKQIRADGVISGTHSVYKLDLSSFASVKSFADEVLRSHPEIHILVNNAGGLQNQRTLTEEGHELTFATNYLGHFYLTHLLLPRLAESVRTRGTRAGRIVNVSSVAHRFPLIGRLHFQDLTLRDNYEEHLAYSQSKLALVMFTKTLTSKLKAAGVPVVVFAVDPGVVYTAIIYNFFAHRVLACVYRLFMRSPEQGARAIYYACASPDLENRGGAYIYSCEETPVGKFARSEEKQSKLWTMTMDLLDLKTFGNLS